MLPNNLTPSERQRLEIYTSLPLEAMTLWEMVDFTLILLHYMQGEGMDLTHRVEIN